MNKCLFMVLILIFGLSFNIANTKELDLSNIKLTNSAGASYISDDGGKTWKPEATEKNNFLSNEILFTTNDGSQYLSKDFGRSWEKIINQDINNYEPNSVAKSKIENGILKVSSDIGKIDKFHIYDSKGSFVKSISTNDLNKVDSGYCVNVDYLPNGMFFLVEEHNGELTLNSIFIK